MRLTLKRNRKAGKEKEGEERNKGTDERKLRHNQLLGILFSLVWLF